ncbi:tetratricopeptide repeat protein [Leptospira interrogans]|uniref:tetratricopeptide repeat protein n=1 Tax=Leptospira interrogans TaxID=173 RepID=UPI0002B9D7FD|nr:hypothetical protein [Leptospira interrogans]MCR8648448.1 hypothetical protein [Leptospira interrogans serovar Bataviae]OAM86116.1 hypothetical protein A1343_15900 [Leptospira interrogans serovar Bataviae]QOI40474.1 hypothetical protein Lepto1548_19700 [Leptospira interrogans serovar Bataviae]
MENKPRIFISSIQNLNERYTLKHHLLSKYSAIFEIVTIESVGSAFSPKQRQLYELRTSQLIIVLLSETLSIAVKEEIEEAMKWYKAIWFFVDSSKPMSIDLKELIDGIKKPTMPSLIEYSTEQDLLTLVELQMRRDIVNLFSLYEEYKSRILNMKEGEIDENTVLELYKLKEYEKAIDIAKRILKKSTSSMAFHFGAKALIKLRKYDSLQNYLDSFEKMIPTEFMNWFYMEAGAFCNDAARAQEERLRIGHGTIRKEINHEIYNHYMRAIEYYKKIEVADIFDQKNILLEYYFNYGNHFYAIGEFKKARSLYYKCLRIDSNNYKYFMSYANSLLMLGKLFFCVIAYRKGYEIIKNRDVKRELLTRMFMTNKITYEIGLFEQNHKYKSSKDDIYFNYLSLSSTLGYWDTHLENIANWISSSLNTLDIN